MRLRVLQLIDWCRVRLVPRGQQARRCKPCVSPSRTPLRRSQNCVDVSRFSVLCHTYWRSILMISPVLEFGCAGSHCTELRGWQRPWTTGTRSTDGAGIDAGACRLRAAGGFQRVLDARPTRLRHLNYVCSSSQVAGANVALLLPVVCIYMRKKALPQCMQRTRPNGGVCVPCGHRQEQQ